MENVMSNPYGDIPPEFSIKLQKKGNIFPTAYIVLDVEGVKLPLKIEYFEQSDGMDAIVLSLGRILYQQYRWSSANVKDGVPQLSIFMRRLR